MNPHSAESSKIVSETLDSVAKKKLQEAVWQRWLLAFAVVATVSALAMMVDWFAAWREPVYRWSGLVLFIVMLIIFGFLAWRRQRKGPDRMAAAKALDRTLKKSRDSWTTFASMQPGGAGGTGSDAMEYAFVRDMAPMCEFLDPATVEPAPPPKRTLTVLWGSVLVLLIFLAIFFGQGSLRLVARFFLPSADLPLTRLTQTSETPEILLRGDGFKVKANVAGKIPDQVFLEIEGEPGPLTADSEKAEFSVEKLQKSIRYRLLSGDAVTAWQTVAITDRPRLATVSLTLKDPPYSTRPPRVWNRLPASVTAIRGSQVVLKFTIDKPVKFAALESEKSPRIALKPTGQTFVFEKNLYDEFVFRPCFESTEGFENAPLSLTRIEMVEDQAPKVELTDQSEKEVLSLHDQLAVAFKARDDIGVKSAEVVFEITDQLGARREVTVPVDLGDEKGKGEISMSTQVDLDKLGISSQEKVSYSVRVRDGASQQSGSSNEKQGQESNGNQQPQSDMTMRPLNIGGGKTGQSKPRQLKVATTEMLNEVEPKQKKLLAVEEIFGSLKALTQRALNHARAAKAPAPVPGQVPQSGKLHRSISSARKDIESATVRVLDLGKEAAGTPYAFLSIQLQSIVRGHLKPADSKLNDAVRNRLLELPPREPHRQQAENFLVQALSKLDSLAETAARVRSNVQAEMALTEMMTMYVAQVEDIPKLLGSGEGTPYQRTPGEVSKAQAEAALKQLEAKKELYRKTAELLRQHPELWQKYMDKSKSESSIFRDQLETLSRRHDAVRGLTEKADSQDAAPESDVRGLIATHQQQIGASLMRSLDKSRTWLETEAPDGTEPDWISSLEKVAFQAVKDANSPAADLKEQASHFNQKLDAAIESLAKTTPSRFQALRLGELKQTRSESGLVAELADSLKTRDWRRAALLEQANIAHHTQKLAGKIEMKGAKLDTLSPEVEKLGKNLNALMEKDLLPPLGEAVTHLSESKINPAKSNQSAAAEAFVGTLRALDQYVVAAIREMDKAPPKAAIGGGPKITANSLEELQQKLAEEQEMSESFGIPCCRPTNLQVMSDWEQVAQCSQPSPSRKPASSPSSQSNPEEQEPEKRQPSQRDQMARNDDSKSEFKESSQSQGNQRSEANVAAMTEKPSQSKPGKPGEKGEGKSSPKVADLAREESMRLAKELASLLSGEPQDPAKATATPGASANSDDGKHHDMEITGYDIKLPGKSDGDKDWNRLSSQLNSEILQDKTDSLPKEYREAIEDYFRHLSKWEVNQQP